MFADRINRIQPSATLAMTSKAAELRAKGVDVLIADTAGRLHNKGHLMQELTKVKRVI